MNPPLRVTFGLIVLNGEPFTRYCLRALYPFAHQIIVVEGAAPGAKGVAGLDGHSSDGTLEAIGRFMTEEDPDRKVTLVTAQDEGHPDGFWPGEKDQQSRAYAKRATGDYLWQVDVDEFYQPQDMETVIKMLSDQPQITGVSFRQITFWGGFNHTVDGPFIRYESGVCTYRRLFKWGPGYQYVTHRPPTVHDDRGRDMWVGVWADGRKLARRGIWMYHYSLVFPKQVQEKCRYHMNTPLFRRTRARNWVQEVFTDLKKPFRVHNVYAYPSWIQAYGGSHPPQAEALRRDLENGSCNVAQRPQGDLERLLVTRRYRLGRALLRAVTPLYRVWFGLLQPYGRLSLAVMGEPSRLWPLVFGRLHRGPVGSRQTAARTLGR